MNHAQKHPAGLTALATTALVMLAQRLDVELSADEAAVIVGLAAAVVSLFTPRTQQA